MQSGERELSLRLHPGAANQHNVISSRAQIVKQRRLPDARLAPKYQGPAAAGPDVEQQLTKRRALPLTTPQGPRRRRRHRLPRTPAPPRPTASELRAKTLLRAPMSTASS